MAVPDYQTLMLPVVEALHDGRECPVREVIERVAQRFDLTAEDRSQLLPSGRIPVYVNRIHWATTYLVKAGLVTRPRRAVAQLTAEGRQVLDASPTRIDNSFLERYPTFVEFRHRPDDASVGAVDAEGKGVVAEPETPEEVLERAWRALRAQVAVDILERLKACSPRRFEE